MRSSDESESRKAILCMDRGWALHNHMWWILPLLIVLVFLGVYMIWAIWDISRRLEIAEWVWGLYAPHYILCEMVEKCSFEEFCAVVGHVYRGMYLLKSHQVTFYPLYKGKVLGVHVYVHDGYLAFVMAVWTSLSLYRNMVYMRDHRGCLDPIRCFNFKCISV